MHREIDFGTTREVLDVAIAAVFWPAGYSPRALLTDLLLQFVVSAAYVDGLRFWWQSNGAGHEAAFADELGLAFVPLFENLVRWCTAQDTGMNEAGEFDAWDVAGAAIYALEIPDGFCSGSTLVKTC
jgi:hypothetical protein